MHDLCRKERMLIIEVNYVVSSAGMIFKTAFDNIGKFIQ